MEIISAINPDEEPWEYEIDRGKWVKLRQITASPPHNGKVAVKYRDTGDGVAIRIAGHSMFLDYAEIQDLTAALLLAGEPGAKYVKTEQIGELTSE
jgi:hypothetical protein